MKRIAIAASLLAALSCGLPCDPDTHSNTSPRSVLHVGVSIAPPFIGTRRKNSSQHCTRTPCKVALTRPYVETRGGKRHVFAVPPGENAFLLRLETFLAEHRDEVANAARSQQ